MTTRELLIQVKEGTISPDEALEQIKTEPYRDINFAKIDLHRNIRQNVSEIIYGAGKSSEQIVGIIKEMLMCHRTDIIVTKVSPTKAKDICKKCDCTYYETAGIISVAPTLIAEHGHILVATGGTSDIPVAEEAAVTAELLGNRVVRLYDVGVAGLHRLISNVDEIMSARVIIAVAGMEGALASVIGGIGEAPLIAVPTSVGYGANFAGLSALLSMLNSCAAGSAVVNIDNGFGAGFIANRINHMESDKS